MAAPKSNTLSMWTILLLLVLTTACMTSTVKLNEGLNVRSKPSYEDYFDSFALGWLGRPTSVSLAAVCMDQKILGYQKAFTSEDAIFSILTWGLYTPFTVRVWCGDK